MQSTIVSLYTIYDDILIILGVYSFWHLVGHYGDLLDMGSAY